MTTATATQKAKSLAEYIDQVALELYTQEEWDESQKGEDLELSFEHNLMLSEAITTAFERNPEVFGSSKWINSESGLPLWVRPGVEWEPSR